MLGLVCGHRGLEMQRSRGGHLEACHCGLHMHSELQFDVQCKHSGVSGPRVEAWEFVNLGRRALRLELS